MSSFALKRCHGEWIVGYTAEVIQFDGLHLVQVLAASKYIMFENALFPIMTETRTTRPSARRSTGGRNTPARKSR
jgi:hypothetical protein